MGTQETSWIKINEMIFEMERRKDNSKEWIQEWNKLITRANKVVGCVKREKYEENHRKATAEKQPKEDREGTDVAGIPSDMEEEKT